MEINHEISLKTELPVQTVQDFVLHWEINEHARFELNGILKNGCEDTVWRRDYIGTEITVTLADTIGQNGNDVLFRGVLQDVKLIRNHGVGLVRLEAASASIMLDDDSQRLCRSFQDPSLNYSDVAKQTAGMGNGSVICTTERKKIEKPVICYKETIWGFLKRLASRQESFLIADIKTGRPNLWFGMRAGKQIDAVLNNWTGIGIQKQYGKKGNSKTVKTYYIECRACYSLGDWTMDHGKKLVIYASEARLEKGDIAFAYYLAADSDITKEMYCNDVFTGMSLWGTVEETKDETLRVTFDIDGEVGTWFYPWRPETGNAMYAMPEVGSKVAVYFMNHEEGSGIAVRCSGQPPENQKPADKSMKTPANGKAELFTSSLNIGKDKEQMEINDSSNISFSGSRIAVEADGKVKLRAKQISLNAASEIKAITE